MTLRHLFYMIGIVGILLAIAFCQSGCTPLPIQKASYGPALIEQKEVRVYKATGKRFVYILEIEQQGRIKNRTLRGYCFARDESLPSRNFVAVDYGFWGEGYDYIGFADGKPMSRQEKLLLSIQLNQAQKMLNERGKLVRVSRL